MDLQPIEMDWRKAKDTIRQYGALLKERRSAEDLAILKSTKAILAGKMVIRLADAIKAGGVDSRGLPKVAIARADDPFVHCKSWGQRCQMVGLAKKEEYVADYHRKRGSWWGRIEQANPRGFVFDLSGKFVDNVEAKAIVPTIPPAHRPPVTAYDRYYILFEAVWDLLPPVDPALLAPLGGGMFVVVAQWDLTDVERAVLAHARAK